MKMVKTFDEWVEGFFAGRMNKKDNVIILVVVTQETKCTYYRNHNFRRESLKEYNIIKIITVR